MDAGRPGSGGTVVPSGRIKVSGDVVRVGEPTPADHHGEKKVSLIRDGGVVRVIEVTCSCGEVTRIQCEYS